MSVGVYTGGLGITISHELVHKVNRLEQWLGELKWNGQSSLFCRDCCVFNVGVGGGVVVVVVMTYFLLLLL